jgi:L-alanine-DL-glutamate epimerase-like enolase superfamily enzyme
MSGARIEAIELVPFALRFRRPYVTARGRLDQRELLLVRLRTDGPTGVGEAAPLALRGGPGLAELAGELETAGMALVGKEPSLGLVDGLELSPQGRAAVDLALHDLIGKVEDEPVWRLLGAERARPVPCNATLTVDKPAAVARQAEDWASRGFRTVKLKLGADRDREQVRAVRKAVGPEIRIRVDANAVWSEQEAIDTLTGIEPHGIELAEQPAATLEELAAVRSATSTPIAADESVAAPADAERAIELRACDMATVKLAKVGGIRRALEVAGKLPVYLSSALDGPVGIAAAAHVAQALTSELFAENVARDEPTQIGAALHVPEGAGLGIDIDERALEGHRL